MDGKNDLVTLVEKNSDMIKYVREHKEEFDSMDFADESVFQTLAELSDDITLLKTYLENARKLEDLRISEIYFEDNFRFSDIQCDVFREKETEKIIYITKYYTDGIIESQKEYWVNDTIYCHHNFLPININAEGATFVLRVNDSMMIRHIYIKDFGFDSKKLPIEEELQSYEIPKTYILK